jgi:endonuclease YncB( thermonuclease family)
MNNKFAFMVIGIILFFVISIFADTKSSKVKNHIPAIITEAKIKDIHDGDTVTIVIEKEIKVRFLDCWSPELNDQKGLEARDYLKTLIKEGDEVMVEIPLEKNITKSLTFGRFLGIIYKDIDSDGKEENLSEEMVKSGHATKIKEQ